MRILVTAGATWIKVDKARILTNIFTGRTGLQIAKGLKKKGHSVTLLINPHCTGKVKGITSVYFSYFDEFKKEIKSILDSQIYDAIIHSAAVSDYKIKNIDKGKIPSGKKNLRLNLFPTEKIISLIRKRSKDSLVIQFKLEASRKKLIDNAYESLKKNKSDFVVANSLDDLDKSFLIGKDKRMKALQSKKSLVSSLDRIIKSKKL